MDESRRLAMRRAHARRAHHCTCGKTVHGNGGENAHREMHKRKGEWRTEGGHYYMTYSEYERRRRVCAVDPAPFGKLHVSNPDFLQEEIDSYNARKIAEEDEKEEALANSQFGVGA